MVTRNANNRQLTGERVKDLELTSGGMLRFRNPKDKVVRRQMPHAKIFETPGPQRQKHFTIRLWDSKRGQHTIFHSTYSQRKNAVFARNKLNRAFGPHLLIVRTPQRNPLEPPFDSDFSGLYTQRPRERGRVLNPIVSGAGCPSCGKPLRNPQVGTGTCSGCGERITVRKA